MILTALTTLAALIAYLSFGLAVARARARYGVAAPATTGDPRFERLYRVQMNTLEWLVVVLPGLWIFGFYVSDRGACAIGAVWILGRLIYARDYAEAAEKRGRGFALQATACFLLLIGALVELLILLVTGG